MVRNCAPKGSWDTQTINWQGLSHVLHIFHSEVMGTCYTLSRSLDVLVSLNNLTSETLKHNTLSFFATS